MVSLIRNSSSIESTYPFNRFNPRFRGKTNRESFLIRWFRTLGERVRYPTTRIPSIKIVEWICRFIVNHASPRHHAMYNSCLVLLVCKSRARMKTNGRCFVFSRCVSVIRLSDFPSLDWYSRPRNTYASSKHHWSRLIGINDRYQFTELTRLAAAVHHIETLCEYDVLDKIINYLTRLRVTRIFESITEFVHRIDSSGKDRI